MAIRGLERMSSHPKARLAKEVEAFGESRAKGGMGAEVACEPKQRYSSLQEPVWTLQPGSKRAQVPTKPRFGGFMGR